MITTDTKRTLPATWTDQECMDLYHHAKELGHNGNPAGYRLTVDLHTFVGYSDEQGNHIKDTEAWDYDGIRAWIAGHQERVQRVWQYQVAPEWW
jgi:hypothetical protein